MAMSEGSAEWNGGFKVGEGTMKPAHAPKIAYSVGSRFEGQQGSNPEELIGAALSGCFSMALAVALETAGFEPKTIRTTANVKLDRDGKGFTITAIELSTEAGVPGVEAAQFDKIAEETKKGCPVSKVLSGARITLKSRLISW